MRNFTVSRSSSPLLSRETPYFDWPNFRGRCWTTTSPVRKPFGGGQHRHEAVQLAVEPNFVHHLAAKRLQAAIVVVQMDARQVADQPVEHARRQHLVPRIVPLVLPAAHDVEAFVELGQQAGDLGRVVLQVAVDA